MGEMPGREKRKEWEAEQRRERIITNAAKLLVKKDIDHITLEEVAKASGYTVQNLYLYFRDKEDLFAAILLKGLDNMLSSATRAFTRAETGIEKVIAVGEEYFNFSLKNPRYFDLDMRFEKKYYVFHKHPTRRLQGEYIGKCQASTDRMGDMMIEAITIGINDGTIQTRLSPKHLMLFLWAQGMGVIQVIMMRRKYFTKIYQLTTDTFLSEFRTFVRKYLSHP